MCAYGTDEPGNHLSFYIDLFAGQIRSGIAPGRADGTLDPGSDHYSLLAKETGDTMRAIEIQRNGVVICKAGFLGATVLMLNLNGDCETAGAGLSVHGMAESEGGYHLHLWWFYDLTIADGDEVTFALVEAANVTTPPEERASNSPEFIADQQEYEKRASLPMVLRKLDRSRAGLIFDVRINGALLKASLDRSREFLSASLLWSDYGAERCRFRVSSFSAVEAMRRTGSKEWLTEAIKLGDTLSVKVYRSLQLVK